ncbi:MAG: metallophosphoesterase family protein, partial [Acidothermaceae bacterium]
LLCCVYAAEQSVLKRYSVGCRSSPRQLLRPRHGARRQRVHSGRQRLDHYREAFATVSARTVVVGHTHMPFDRLADRRRIINPGSVGLGYGHAGAAWALLGPDVTQRRSAFDPDATATRLPAAASDMPGIESFVDNAHQSVSDADALEAFTETSHQQARVGCGDP